MIGSKDNFIRVTVINTGTVNQKDYVWSLLISGSFTTFSLGSGIVER